MNSVYHTLLTQREIEQPSENTGICTERLLDRIDTQHQIIHALETSRRRLLVGTADNGRAARASVL